MNDHISILLADDDEMIRASMAIWLEDEGFKVHTAASGRETVQLLATHRIDVALVDLHLGDTDGEELISQVIVRHPGTRFMICTGKHFYQLPPRLRGHGMRQDDIVYKPIIELNAFSALIRHKSPGSRAQ